MESDAVAVKRSNLAAALAAKLDERNEAVRELWLTCLDLVEWLEACPLGGPPRASVERARGVLAKHRAVAAPAVRAPK
jgi:hypothetical protein